MPHITLDGVDYPALEDDLTLDEAVWFFKIAGVGPEVLDELAASKQFHPPATKALVCLMISRQRQTSHAEIEARVGAIKLTELEEMFATMMAEEAGQSPPAMPEQPESSGEPSSAASDASPDEDDLRATGSQPSDTGALSDQEISVGLRQVN